MIAVAPLQLIDMLQRFLKWYDLQFSQVADLNARSLLTLRTDERKNRAKKFFLTFV
ncbi:hypothetical protein WKK05_25895 [Nostoc sp. UHCC 0302]|uniref:hypothetical protein n=1 Tax=Nostoc sp. UHCC 0302 TaxID=3134896 RepID=UPI00311CE14B